MAAQDNGKVQRIQGGDTLNFVTGATITYNSTQLPAIDSATTAATSSLAGAITAINALGGLFNTLKLDLKNLGFHAST